MTDERGFDSDAHSCMDLSLEDLQAAFKELALKNSKLTLNVRVLKTEIQQIKLLMIGEGITTKGLANKREILLKDYVTSLKPLKPIKPKRGRPQNLEQIFQVDVLWWKYELREDKTIKVKTWLRKLIEDDYTFHKVSLIAREHEIERLVNKLAVQMTRSVKPKRYKNKL